MSWTSRVQSQRRISLCTARYHQSRSQSRFQIQIRFRNHFRPIHCRHRDPPRSPRPSHSSHMSSRSGSLSTRLQSTRHRTRPSADMSGGYRSLNPSPSPSPSPSHQSPCTYRSRVRWRDYSIGFRRQGIRPSPSRSILRRCRCMLGNLAERRGARVWSSEVLSSGRMRGRLFARGRTRGWLWPGRGRRRVKKGRRRASWGILYGEEFGSER